MSTVTEKMHPFAAAKAVGREPYKVQDLALAEFGRKEIRLAEQEMPGLMALRKQHEPSDRIRHIEEVTSRLKGPEPQRLGVTQGLRHNRGNDRPL